MFVILSLLCNNYDAKNANIKNKFQQIKDHKSLIAKVIE